MERKFLYLDPEEILESDDFKTIEYFLKSTYRMRIGWHYIVDLIWIYSKAKHWPDNYRVLDAGGGRGPAQFLLAEMGFNVTNIDLFHLIPYYAQRQRYKLHKTELDSYVASDYVQHIESFRNIQQIIKIIVLGLIKMPVLRSISSYVYSHQHEKWRRRFGFQDREVGSVEWVLGNLCDIPEYTDDTFDAVVSLSALEHIPIDVLPLAMSEIDRIVKPNGQWAITTSGTNKGESWFHEPSKGYCFSESDFEKIFLAQNTNKIKADLIFNKYNNCAYLKDNLTSFYKKSGENGMPWGVWDPQYIPVGISNR